MESHIGTLFPSHEWELETLQRDMLCAGTAGEPGLARHGPVWGTQPWRGTCGARWGQPNGKVLEIPAQSYLMTMAVGTLWEHRGCGNGLTA